jgi:hypothetical protein
MMPWFSSKLRYAVLDESEGFQFYMDSVRLFRALDYDDAFARALKIGLNCEKEYRNERGDRVAWRLASIVSLDKLPAELEDGQEVYSEPIEADSNPTVSIGFDTELRPDLSTPTQTR